MAARLKISNFSTKLIIFGELFEQVAFSLKGKAVWSKKFNKKLILNEKKMKEKLKRNCQ